MEICRGKYGTFRVLLGKKLAMNWFFTDVANGAMFASVMEEIREAASSSNATRFFRSLLKDLALPRCNIAKNASDEGMEVTLGLNVRKILSRFGEYVTFSFSSADKDQTSTNAQRLQLIVFALLTAGAQAAATPSHLTEAKGAAAEGRCGRGDWRLYNEVRVALGKARLGFRREQAPTIGKIVINTLAEVMYKVSHANFRR